MKRRDRDEDDYEFRPEITTLVIAQLENGSDIMAIRDPLRRIALASVSRANVTLKELRDAATGHPEFRELLELPPERVEHTERTAAGTWRYLKDKSAPSPSWAIRTFRDFCKTRPHEDRIPPPEIETEVAVVWRVSKLIAAAAAAPVRPPTRRQLEKKLEALKRLVLAWQRRWDFDPDEIGFSTFEESYDEHPAEYFAVTSNPGAYWAGEVRGDGSVQLLPSDDGPCVLVMTVTGDANRGLEFGREDSRIEFDALIEATQFQYEWYSACQIWFFAREQWLVEAYARYYESTRPMRAPLVKCTWQEIDRAMRDPAPDSLLGRIVHASIVDTMRLNEFGMIVGESDSSVLVMELPKEASPNDRHGDTGTETPVTEPAILERCLDQADSFTATKNPQRSPTQFHARLNRYGLWDGTPKRYDRRD